MGNVVSITGPKQFTLEEVNNLLPLITRITEKYETLIEKHLAEQRFYFKSGAPQHVVNGIDIEVGKLMNEWGAKILKLGGRVIGTKAVSFDSGFGYWSWLYGEKEISYYYDYTEQIHQRRKLGIIVNDPQRA